MGRKPLPIGISDFRRVIEGGYAYADKSLLVQELVEMGTSVALIPRPRRFGKTLNLSMLNYFFEKGQEDTSHLFKHLKIWQHEKCREMHGKFPVIFLTFKDVKHPSWENTFEHFSILLAREFQRHSYLQERFHRRLETGQPVTVPGRTPDTVMEMHPPSLSKLTFSGREKSRQTGRSLGERN